PPKADLCGAIWDVRFGPEADITTFYAGRINAVWAVTCLHVVQTATAHDCGHEEAFGHLKLPSHSGWTLDRDVIAISSTLWPIITKCRRNPRPSSDSVTPAFLLSNSEPPTSFSSSVIVLLSEGCATAQRLAARLKLWSSHKARKYRN